ncbi:MAG: S-layer homology domain-containing protein, partial [Defluviitaleaceae bacterium]|nr:S-layer homology domain-containing protein [Defluviitaleaceae bacterium]
VNHGHSISASEIPTPEPHTGWSFTDWTPNPDGYIVEGNIEFFANFSRIQHTVTFTANPSEGGTLNGTTSITVNHGHSISASEIPTPEPHTGWSFTGWTPNPDGHIVEGNVEFFANFSRTQHTVAISNLPHASVVNPTGQTINGIATTTHSTIFYNDTVTLVAGTTTDWTFLGWFRSDDVPSTGATVPIPTDNTHTFQMPNNVIHYVAVWGNETGVVGQPNTPIVTHHTVSISNFPYVSIVSPIGQAINGIITNSNPAIQYNQTVTLSAGNTNNWTFLGWFKVGNIPTLGTTVPIPINNIHTFQMTDTDIHYVAVWGSQEGVVGQPNSPNEPVEEGTILIRFFEREAYFNGSNREPFQIRAVPFADIAGSAYVYNVPRRALTSLVHIGRPGLPGDVRISRAGLTPEWHYMDDLRSITFHELLHTNDYHLDVFFEQDINATATMVVEHIIIDSFGNERLLESPTHLEWPINTVFSAQPRVGVSGYMFSRVQLPNSSYSVSGIAPQFVPSTEGVYTIRLFYTEVPSAPSENENEHDPMYTLRFFARMGDVDMFVGYRSVRRSEIITTNPLQLLELEPGTEIEIETKPETELEPETEAEVELESKIDYTTILPPQVILRASFLVSAFVRFYELNGDIEKDLLEFIRNDIERIQSDYGMSHMDTEWHDINRRVLDITFSGSDYVTVLHVYEPTGAILSVDYQPAQVGTLIHVPIPKGLLSPNGGNLVFTRREPEGGLIVRNGNMGRGADVNTIRMFYNNSANIINDGNENTVVFVRYVEHGGTNRVLTEYAVSPEELTFISGIPFYKHGNIDLSHDTTSISSSVHYIYIPDNNGEPGVYFDIERAILTAILNRGQDNFVTFYFVRRENHVVTPPSPNPPSELQPLPRPPFVLGPSQPNPAPDETVETLEPVSPEQQKLISWQRRYVSGFEDGTFKPDSGITRAEMAQMFFNLSNDPNKYGQTFTGFIDVNETGWYFEAISYFANSGVLVGFPDGSFKPNQNITNAEFAQFISVLLDLKPVENMNYIIGHWSAQAVNSAFNQAILDYFPSSYGFGRDNIITRAEAITTVNYHLNRISERTSINEYLDTRAYGIYKDVTPNHWAFYQIMEASINHFYIRNGGQIKMWLTPRLNGRAGSLTQ